jgi:hypothetical protein
MNLEEKIQKKKEEFQKAVPEEVKQIMGRAIKSLMDSGILERALGEGVAAPDFTLRNARGEQVNLKETLSSGPVVLGFYRGRW